jgi:uncharacterized membrane protein YdfJ with MMPL/SSD domain
MAVIVVWIAGLVAVGAVVSQVGAATTNDLQLPGTDSQRATDVLAARFPPQQNGKSPIVFYDAAHGLIESAQTAAVAQAITDIRKVPHVVSAVSPYTQQGASQLSKDGHTAFTPVLLDVGAADLTAAEAQAVLTAAQGPAGAAGIEVSAGGNIGSVLSTPKTESSEIVGIVAAMIILTFAFGTLVAMGMPIISAVIGLVLGLSLIGLLGHLVNVPTIGPTVATMIGLGVGIDYALFLVNKYRKLLDEGAEVNEGVARTVATTGSAIVFAGGTVVIALISLAVAGIPLVSSMGYSAAVAVATAVLAAITFLPAVLALLGRRIERLRLPAVIRRPKNQSGTGIWDRWAAWVTAHPWIAVGITALVLTPLLIPVASLHLGQEDVGATPTSTTERVAYDRIDAGFGPGYNGPFLIAVRMLTPATADPAVVAQENQLTALQAQLESEQSYGQAQAASLQRQADSLKQQQAVLEAEAAALERQAAYLTAQAAYLQSQRASLRRQAAALRAEARHLLAQLPNSGAITTRLLEDAATYADQAAADRAKVQQLRAELAASGDQARRREILREIAKLNLAGHNAAQKAAAAKAKAASFTPAAIVAEARSLRNQAVGLVAQAKRLAAQEAALVRQAAVLKQREGVLAAQGASLQRQAAALQAQEAQLAELQKTAAAQQQQAEALKAQLTAELTKAGGDDRGTDPRLVKLQDALTATAGVQVVSPPQINSTGDAVVYTLVPTTAPSAIPTADLVGTVRGSVIPTAIAGQAMQVYVGGSTASNVDLASEIAARLPLVILVVLTLSFVVLLVAFHSLAVPLQAALTNLVCVAAAFGVMTAAFQWGWGINIFHVDTPSSTVPIASYVPLMMFAVLFGLSMDYQVFLLSQVAQHRAAGKSDREAVASGLALAARVISAAALIMIAVFGSFVLNGDPTVKQFGVGLAVAVALAAGSVLLLTPAILVLLGRIAWWMPSLLERVVPTVDIDGENLTPHLVGDEATGGPDAVAVTDHAE